jgi:hypothetical protein
MFISLLFFYVSAQRGGGMARSMASFSTQQNQMESQAGWGAVAGAAISVAGRQSNHPQEPPKVTVWSGCRFGNCDSKQEVYLNPVPLPPPIIQQYKPPTFLSPIITPIVAPIITPISSPIPPKPFHYTPPSFSIPPSFSTSPSFSNPPSFSSPPSYMQKMDKILYGRQF